MTQLSGFGSLAAIPEEKISDKITRRMLAGQKGMMVWWKIGAGTHVAAHSHPHEQLVWIIKGKMEFRIDKERRVLEAGGIAVFPGGVEHEGWCHEDTEVVGHIRTATRGFFGWRWADMATREKLKSLVFTSLSSNRQITVRRRGEMFQARSLS